MPQTKIFRQSRLWRCPTLSCSNAHTYVSICSLFVSWWCMCDVAKARNVATWHSRKCLIHARVCGILGKYFWTFSMKHVSSQHQYRQCTQQFPFWPNIFGCVLYLIHLSSISHTPAAHLSLALSHSFILLSFHLRSRLFGQCFWHLLHRILVVHSIIIARNKLNQMCECMCVCV